MARLVNPWVQYFFEYATCEEPMEVELATKRACQKLGGLWGIPWLSESSLMVKKANPVYIKPVQ